MGGCTKAIVASYEPGIELKNNKISDENIAVYQFEDRRAWVDISDGRSKSFIGQQGPWKFGLDYEGVEFQSVSIMLQDVFIKEFNSIGVKAFKGETASSPSYSLKGEIINFEFENETGIFTVTSRRHVSLALTLEDKNGKALLANELFNELNREDEGMGILHSTNVDKLMKSALKKVMKSVINRTNEELASIGFKTIAITLNGVDLAEDKELLSMDLASYLK